MPNIQPLVEIGVNYICFIMANQAINWDNDYQTTYADFLPADQRRILQDCKADLCFGNGNGGDLDGCFFFFPAYLNLKTEDENTDYYGLISYSVASGDWSDFELNYHKELEHVREFMPDYLSDEEHGRPSKSYARKVRELGKVFCDNFSRYLDTIWQSEKAFLDKYATQIPGLWGGEDIISIWEKQTGLQFTAPSYRILLVKAMLNGPGANSLAFDTNTFGIWDDESCLYYYKHFISHEVGAHLLGPVTVFAMTDADMIYFGYIAMENLARYLNVKMFDYEYGNDSSESYYHWEYFQKLYAELDKQNPEANVKTLFDLAVKQAVKDNIKPE